MLLRIGTDMAGFGHRKAGRNNLLLPHPSIEQIHKGKHSLRLGEGPREYLMNKGAPKAPVCPSMGLPLTMAFFSPLATLTQTPLVRILCLHLSPYSRSRILLLSSNPLHQS